MARGVSIALALAPGLLSELVLVLVLALVLALGGGGCGGADGLELFVDVRTDLVPDAEFSGVRTELVLSGERREVLATADRDWLGGTRVAEIEGLAPGTREVRVSLLDGGALVAVRTVRFAQDASLAVTVVVTRDCVGVACGDGMTCIGGTCGDPTCSDAAPDDCPAPECASDGECAAAPSCGPGRCIAGLCLSTGCAGGGGDGGVDARDGGGADGGRADGGARDAGPVDAGPADAGARDAGASECLAPYRRLTGLGGCYRYETGYWTWLGAERQCEREGSHLVVIDDDREHDAIRALIGATGEVWIGLSDLADEGMFRWVTAGGVDPGGMCLFEPDNPSNTSANDCVRMGAMTCGEWTVHDCGDTRRYVCERDGRAVDPGSY